MERHDIEALIETDLAGANQALASGWAFMAVTHASSPQIPGQMQTVYVMGKPPPRHRRPRVRTPAWTAWHWLRWWII
ncbi:hypothetical protein [Pseudomonas sp. KNUC1026]|uniref:hypothetical protein n=1 Tax=Pseudomonas sp. KNUC1026 TaxID=2893890 RepID=UPI001F38487F|nr:hypothetical protein [Pseudomonas sp. KNUC1026]UFH50984.1 hypothetical protein LN139_07905 [Pseudomonas sp. KNUC1026]